MGHQVPTPLVPESERVGCGEPHDSYNFNCFGCHVINGGADD